LFWEIFIAFDAGEFVHDERPHIEPSQSHSRPMIIAILARIGTLAHAAANSER